MNAATATSTTTDPEVQAILNRALTDLNSVYQKRAASAVQGIFGSGAPTVNGAPTAAAATVAAAATNKPTPAAPRKNKKPAAAAASDGKSDKRSEAVISALVEAVHGFVTANPGKNAEEIAAGMKTTTSANLIAFKRLLGANRLVKQGEKRATRYFPAPS